MGTSLSNFVSLLIGQLPLLIVYVIGLFTAHTYRQEYPQAAGRVTWAIVLLLGDAIVLSFVSQWLVNTIAMQGADMSNLMMIVSAFGLLRSLIHAWAFMLILHAVFPGAAEVRWPRRLLGGVIGLLVGGVLGMVLGDAIATAFGVSSFEGASGYFVILVVLPVLAIVGAILGVIISGLPRPLP